MSNLAQYKNEKITLKWVYYEGSDTLKRGYLLCYNNDTTTDMDGDTIAEGSHCNGKFLRVEKPKTENIPYLAGVVPAAYDGFVGPGFIEIIEPDGHAVEVYSDADDDPIVEFLYAQNASYAAGTSGVAAIGRPLEAVDRSGVNGLILVKLNSPTAEVAEATSINTRISTIEDLDADQSTSISQALSTVASAKVEYDSIDLIADSASAAVASAKLVYDSIALIANSASAGVASAELVYDSTGLIANSASASNASIKLVVDSVSTSVASMKTLESSDVVDIKSSLSSNLLVTNSVSVSAASIELIADSASAAVASAKLIYDSTTVLESSDVVDIKSSLSSNLLVTNSVSVSVGSIELIADSASAAAAATKLVADSASASIASAKLVYDSVSTSQASTQLLLASIDSDATALLAGMTVSDAASTVASNLYSVVTMLKSLNVG